MSKAQVIRYASNKERRALRIRSKISAESLLPRLSVHRTNKYLYAQVIDVVNGKSVAGARGEKPEDVGKTIAEKSLKAGVKKVVFDRGAYSYHGKVKALADSAREGGLQF